MNLYLIIVLTSVIDLSTSNLCSHGWEICQANGECIPQDCIVNSGPSSRICGSGQKYCQAKDACVPSACSLHSTAPMKRMVGSREECGGELQFCFSAGKCLPEAECSDSSHSIQCERGTFCPTTNRCQEHECLREGQTSCPLGQVFCLEQNKCVQEEACKATSIRCKSGQILCPSTGSCSTPDQCKNLLTHTSTRCPPGEIFCPSSGFCTTADDCNLERTKPTISVCLPGQIFCLSTGSCSTDDECKSVGRTPIKCPAGEIFCLSTGSCTTDDRCKFKNQFTRCPANEIFCLSTGSCTTEDRCQLETHGTRCPPGERFCMSSRKCQKENTCSQRPSNTLDQMCPRGTIYCPQTRECISTKEMGHSSCRAQVKCSKGMTFCASLGRCAYNCAIADDETPASHGSDGGQGLCPHIVNQWNSSSCLVSLDCLQEHTCCRDSGTMHRQCVPLQLDRRNETSNETTTCASLMNSNVNTDTGLTCNDPWDCPPDSVCCDGVCRAMKCPFLHTACSMKGKCISREESCGVPCEVGKAYCIATDTCLHKDECELDGFIYVSWMMPGPIFVSLEDQSVSGQSTKVSALYNKDVEVLTPEILVVNEIFSVAGKFEIKRSEAEGWDEVTRDSIVMTTDYLRFTTEAPSYAFIMATLNVTHNETGVHHLIVQLIAPSKPEQRLELTKTSILIVEDSTAILGLNEFFSLTDAAEIAYWEAFENAQDMVAVIPGDGFLDNSHPTTMEWLDLISGRDAFGLKLTWDEFMSDKGFYVKFSGQEYNALNLPVGDVYFSLAGDDENWEDLSLSKPFTLKQKDSTSKISDVIMKIEPIANENGEMELSFASTDKIINDEAQMFSDESQVFTFKIKIMAVNDPPYVRNDRPLINGINKEPDNPDGITQVEELMSQFYYDVEGDAIGMVVLAVQESDLGHYQYSMDEGVNWIDLSPMNEHLLKKEEPMKRRLSSRRSLKPFGNSRIIAKQDHSRKKRQTAETTGEQIRVIFLPPNILIRFVSQDGKSYALIEYSMKAQLLVTAFDDSRENRITVAYEGTITFPPCSDCRTAGETISEIVITISPVSYGCDGLVQISDEPKVVDRCRICGGDGSLCVDCANHVEGSSVFVCGACWRKEDLECSPSDSCRYSSDCQGNICKHEFHVTIQDEISLCVPLNVDGFTFCDGRNVSGAYINSCGACVEGNSSLTDQDTKDACFFCQGSGAVCDPCLNLAPGMALDSCTQSCLPLNDPDLNNCNAMVEPKPPYIDVSTPSLPAIRFKVIGIDVRYLVTECKAINILTNQEVAANEVSISESLLPQVFVNAHFLNLAVGMWKIECLFNIEDGIITTDPPEVILQTNENSHLKVVDSHKLKLILDAIEFWPGEKINVTVEEYDGLEYANCFLKYQLRDGVFILELPTERLEEKEDTLLCYLPTYTIEGTAELGVSLSHEAIEALKSDENFNLVGEEVVINSKAPILRSATISSAESKLTLGFDRNIKMEGCEENFHEHLSFGNNPKCEARDSLIIISLGEDYTLKNETNVTLIENNAIRAKFAPPNHLQSAVGSVPVTRTKNKVETFQLFGSKQACNESEVEISAVIFAPEKGNFKVVWNVTWVKGNVDWEQTKVLQVWDSINIIDSSLTHADAKITFNGNILLPSIQYLFVAHIEWDDGSVSEKQEIVTVKVPDEQEIIVNIAGPTKIFLRRTYVYQAEVLWCLEQDTEPQLQYLWSVSGNVDLKLEDVIGQTFTLSSESLQPVTNYNITVSVFSTTGTISATASLTIMTYDEDPFEVVLSTSAIRVGYLSPIRVNAEINQLLTSHSKEVKSKYTCSTESEPYCLSTRDKVPALFENVVPLETLSTPHLHLPPGLLLPSDKEYQLKLQVSNGVEMDSKEAVIKVEVVAESTPDIAFIEDTKKNFLVDKPITLEGHINSNESFYAWWEPVHRVGSDFANIYKVALAGAKKTFIPVEGQLEMFPYHLVLPPADPSYWSGLLPMRSYTFRINALTLSRKLASTEITITTAPLPENAVLKLTPSNGFALITPFEFNLSLQSTELINLPYEVSFGYHLKRGENDNSSSVLVKLNNVYSNTSVSQSLPPVAENEELTPFAIVCNTVGSCANLKSPKIIVSLPDQIDVELLNSKLEEIKTLLPNDATIEAAFAKTKDLLVFLQDMGVEEEVMNTVNNILVDSIVDKGNYLINSIASSTESRATAYKMLDGILPIESLVQNKLIIDLTGEMLKRLQPLNEVEEILPKRSSAVNRRSRPPRSLPEISNFLTSKKGNVDRISRRKRDTDEANANGDPKAKFTTEEIKTYLKFSEKQINLSNVTQGRKNQILTSVTLVVNSFMESLCLGLNVGMNVTVANTLLAITVVRSNLLGNILTTPMVIPGISGTQDINYVIWGDDLNIYKHWMCPEIGGVRTCAGLCLGMVMYGDFFQAPLLRAEIPGQLRGKMIRTVLMDPSTGKSLKAPDEFPLKYALTANQTKVDGQVLKCFGWDTVKWSSEVCQKEIHPRSAASPRDDLLRCSCDDIGYVGAFSVKIGENGERPTVEPNNLPSTLKMVNLTLVLDGNYSKVVEGKEKEFGERLIEQLAEELGISKDHIKIYRIYSGSINVDIGIGVNDGQRASTGVDQTTSALANLVNKGFTITGLDSEDLKLLQIKYPTEEPVQAIDHSTLPILIGGIVGGVLLLAVALFILALCFNKKKRMDKVTPLNNSGSINYTNIVYAHDLKGTHSSFSRFKSQESYGRRTGGTNSRGSHHSGDVPSPPHYSPPTKKQLEESQRISEPYRQKIHMSASKGLLPGSPEEPIKVNDHIW